LSRLAQKLGFRFSIEIHPIDAKQDHQHATVTKIQARRVEFIVAAS
jgi:hypothetical protein